jgi:hypothetical protein
MIERFECKMCDFVEEYSNYDAPVECPQCRHRFYTLRYIESLKIKPKFVNIGYKDTPRYSMTLGVSETQIEDAKKLHPQAEWKRFGHSFRPLIKNRPEKLKMMAQAGMQEYDPKGFKGRE